MTIFQTRLLLSIAGESEVRAKSQARSNEFVQRPAVQRPSIVVQAIKILTDADLQGKSRKA